MSMGQRPSGALLLGNGVEGDDQAADDAAGHVGKALDGAVQAAQHLGDEHFLGGELGQLVDALGIHGGAVDKARLHLEVLVVLGIVRQDLGSVGVAVLAVGDGGGAVELLLQAVDTSLGESSGQQGVLNHLVLAASLPQLLSQLGVLLHGDAAVVHQHAHVGLLEGLAELSHLLLLLLKNLLARQLNSPPVCCR